MAVFRIEKTREYTVMLNHHLHNKRLSFKAKGLMSFMLSLPENWNYTERGLSHFGKDGRDSIRAAISELEAEGYLIRNKKRNPDGTLGEMEYTIYEQPVLAGVRAETIENADSKPGSENPTIQSNNIQNNKKQSTYYNSLSDDSMSEQVKNHITYKDLLPLCQKEMIDNVLNIILELRLLAGDHQNIRIGQTKYPSELVRMKLAQIDFSIAVIKRL